MNRRRFLASGAALGVGATAGCLGTLGIGDQNQNVVLGAPDRTADVSSEDLPYPAWGQRVPDVTRPAPVSGGTVSVRDVDRQRSNERWLAETRTRVGLEGAAFSTNPDEVRTAGANAVSDEDRNKSRESRTRGPPRSSRLHSQRCPRQLNHIDPAPGTVLPGRRSTHGQ